VVGDDAGRCGGQGGCARVICSCDPASTNFARLALALRWDEGAW
jgi:hypothetical protein